MMQKKKGNEAYRWASGSVGWFIPGGCTCHWFDFRLLHPDLGSYCWRW